MRYIDELTTVWYRYYIPDDLELPEFKSEEDVDDFLLDNDYRFQTEIIPEVSDRLDIKNNGGFSTLEVYDDTTLLFRNGK